MLTEKQIAKIEFYTRSKLRLHYGDMYEFELLEKPEQTHKFSTSFVFKIDTRSGWFGTYEMTDRIKGNYEQQNQIRQLEDRFIGELFYPDKSTVESYTFLNNVYVFKLLKKSKKPGAWYEFRINTHTGYFGRYECNEYGDIRQINNKIKLISDWLY